MVVADHDGRRYDLVFRELRQRAFRGGQLVTIAATAAAARLRLGDGHRQVRADIGYHANHLHLDFVFVL